MTGFVALREFSALILADNLTCCSSNVTVRVVGSSNSNSRGSMSSSLGNCTVLVVQLVVKIRCGRGNTSLTGQVVMCDDVKGVVDWGQCRKDGACYL